MKYNTIFLFLTCFSLLVFSGCSDDVDCTSYDSTYVKYSYDETTNSCVVSNNIQKDVCGNKIVEKGEDYCSCPDDVEKTNPTLGCDGSVGDYIENTCNKKKQCVFLQNSKVVEETKILEFDNSDLTINSEILINNPFVLNTQDNNKVKIILSLYDKKQGSVEIDNLIIKDISIENRDSTRFAYQKIDLNLKEIGDSLDLIELNFKNTSEYESEQYLKFKLTINYIKNTYDKDGNIVKSESEVETLINSLGKWTIINPNFYE